MPAPRLARASWPRLVPMLAAGTLLVLGWGMLWPLGFAFSRTPEFSSEYLQRQPWLGEALWPLVALVGAISGVDPMVPSFRLLMGLGLAFVAAGAGYLAGIVLLARGAGRTAWALPLVVGVALLSQGLLLLMPGVLTTDPFSYIMYGYLSGVQHLNPYVASPSTFPDHPLTALVHPMWRQQPSVYGPLWEQLAGILARAVQGLDVQGQVLTLKLVMNAVQLANLALVWWLLGRLRPLAAPGQRVTDFAVYAWNPLVLFEAAAGVHNDSLMLTLVLLGLVPVAATLGGRRGESGAGSTPELRWLSGSVLLSLSALVKYTSALMGMFYLAAWLRQPGVAGRRSLALAGAVVAGGGLALWLFWPWLQQPGALAPVLAAAGGERAINSVPDLLARATAALVLTPAGWDGGVATETTRTWVRTATRIAFAGYLAWELARVWRRAALARGDDPDGPAGRAMAVHLVLEASTRAYLVLLLAVLTWVLAWYFTWPLTLAALLGWRHQLTRLVVGYTLTAAVIFNVRDYWYLTTGAEEMPGPLLLLYALTPPLVLLLLPAFRFAGRRSPRLPSSFPSARPPESSGCS